MSRGALGWRHSPKGSKGAAWPHLSVKMLLLSISVIYQGQEIQTQIPIRPGSNMSHSFLLKGRGGQEL